MKNTIQAPPPLPFSRSSYRAPICFGSQGTKREEGVDESTALKYYYYYSYYFGEMLREEKVIDCVHRTTGSTSM